MKKCAFCTNPADSREHIYSDWMVQKLPRNELWHFNERLRSGEYVSYKGRKVQLKTKVVCTACNNRWMSDLENKHMKAATDDLLMGNNIATLHAKEIAAITAFAFKTTVLENHKDLRTTTFFPASDR